MHTSIIAFIYVYQKFDYGILNSDCNLAQYAGWLANPSRNIRAVNVHSFDYIAPECHKSHRAQKPSKSRRTSGPGWTIH